MGDNVLTLWRYSSAVERVVRGSESETEAPSFDWFDNLFEQIPKDTINVTETK